MSFNIIHSDIWTFPILSSVGHQYYVLFLDDYSNYCGLLCWLESLMLLRNS